MKVTIKDVARIAGVSLSTVSRVINNSKPVNEDVRNRVLEAMRRTNYRGVRLPVPGAASGASSSTIGVIIPEYGNTVLDDFIVGIHRVAKLYGCVVMIGMTDGMAASELEYLRRFRDMQPDGLIFAGTAWGEAHSARLKEIGIPCVLVGQESCVPGIPSVHVDNVMASYEAVTYLVRKGHRDIAMICGTDAFEVGARRLQGFRQAMTDAGLPVREERIAASDISVDDGRRAMGEILSVEGDPPTAVFCATDLMAIGAMHCLIERGIKIPEEVSVFGFDGSFASKIVRPKLSTVAYSATEIGMTAARHLMKLMKGETSGVPQHANVMHHLEIRESTT